MTRKLVIFAAVLFNGLVAGAAFAIWIDYNPSGMSPSFYTQKMQHAIQVFTIPLPTVVLLAVLFTILSTVLARHNRSELLLLGVASICIIAVAVITALGNIPINNQIKTWNVSSPPLNWSDLAQRWWHFQTGRTLAAIGGLCFSTIAGFSGRGRYKQLARD